MIRSDAELRLLHYYNQKNPPSLDEIINAPPLEQYFYWSSMAVDLEDKKEGTEALSF